MNVANSVRVTGGLNNLDPRRVVDRAAMRNDDEDRIRNRAFFLSPEDRALLEGLYGKGMTSQELARLLSVSPETVRRRGRRLLAHLRSPLFGFVLSHRSTWSRSGAIKTAICKPKWPRHIAHDDDPGGIPGSGALSTLIVDGRSTGE